MIKFTKNSLLTLVYRFNIRETAAENYRIYRVSDRQPPFCKLQRRKGLWEDVHLPSLKKVHLFIFIYLLSLIALVFYSFFQQ